MELMRAAWKYRGFIRSSIVNEFKARALYTRFGLIWLILHPLAQVLVFALVLSNVLAARLGGIDSKYAYAGYLMSGILCWSLFADLVQRSSTVFIDNAALLKQISFPRIALPLIVIGSSVLTSMILLVVMLVVFSALELVPTVQVVWLPLLYIVLILFGIGVGLIFGTLNVFMRGAGQSLLVILQFWFWLTPIVYPASIVPADFAQALAANPMAPLVAGFQNVLVYGVPPPFQVTWVAILSLFLLVVSLFLFRRGSSEMVDVL